MSERKAKIIYVYDALCGWCYGFSPVIKKIYDEHKHDIDFEIVSGGMVLNEKEGIVTPEMTEYILASIPRVEEYAGVQFGGLHKQQLREGILYQSSLKPSAALCAFKKHLPEQAIYFAHDMQRKFFYEGKSLEEDDTYTKLAETYKIDAAAFVKETKSDQYKYLAHLEFDYVQKLGVTGFPALIGVKNNEYYWLSEGYQPYENVKQAVLQLMQIGVTIT